MGSLESPLKLETGGALSLNSKKCKEFIRVPSTSYEHLNTRRWPIWINFPTKVGILEQLLKVDIGGEFSLNSKIVQKVRGIKP